MRLWVEIPSFSWLDHSRSSASSWGCELKYKGLWVFSVVVLSASSWGCELKCQFSTNPHAVPGVSLFVRLWVEMWLSGSAVCWPSSASSWGCELKCVHHHSRKAGYCQPLREAVSWNNGGKIQYVRYPMSASSWGCELKYPGSVLGELEAGQPLRKAVSWNKKHDNYYVAGPVVSLFVRLWVEIWHATPYTLRQDRQPLREAVSWNTNNLTAINSK